MHCSLFNERARYISLTRWGMAILRSLYNAGGWKTFLDGLMCAMFAWFIKDILLLFSINHQFAYLASVFIGYVGIEPVSKLLIRKNRS